MSIQKGKILVLGSNGFLGRNFQEFVVNNERFKQFDFYFSDVRILHDLVPGSVYYAYDLSDINNMNHLIMNIKPDHIVNLAGAYGIADPSIIYNANTKISQNVLEIIRKNNLLNVHVLLVGSAAEYGNSDQLPLTENSPLKPINIYGLSKKHQSEHALFYKENFKMKVSIGRVFNTIGKYQPLSLSISSFINQIAGLNDNEELLTGNIDTKRDFIDVMDVISGFFHILESDKPDVYNICSGYSMSIKEILLLLIQQSGKKIKIKFDHNLQRTSEIRDSFGSNDKLKRATGWINTVDIEKSLKLLM